MRNFAVFAWFGVIVMAVVGWFMNIFAILNMTSFWPLTGEAVLRVVGIFVPPLGSIMGLFV